MTQVASRDVVRTDRAVQVTPRWTWANALVGLGALFLILEVWVYGSWIASGPHSIDGFSDHSSASWYGTLTFEGLVVVIAMGVLVHLVKDYRRIGRLPFDAIICIAGLSAAWLDPEVNWLQPVFFYSSNWVNLNDWSAHVPFALNPAAGKSPEPVLFIFLMYAFGFLAFIMAINWIMRAVRTRWPTISSAPLVALAAAFGIICDLVLEVPMYRFHMWAYPGAPNVLSLWSGTESKYPLIEMLMASLIWTGLACIRFFKDEKGLTILERRLVLKTHRSRALPTTLALVAVMNLLLIVGDGGVVIGGLYSARYPALPSHLLNTICGPNTSYGQCPGSNGYKIPITHH